MDEQESKLYRLEETIENAFDAERELMSKRIARLVNRLQDDNFHSVVLSWKQTGKGRPAFRLQHNLELSQAELAHVLLKVAQDNNPGLTWTIRDVA